MFKLGEYGEEEVNHIADCLKSTGMKVDLKPSITASVVATCRMKGKLSELKERDLLENLESYECILSSYEKGNFGGSIRYRRV